jgi:hypothetical protein
VTEPETPTVADLFHELQETNRVLRELVSQMRVGQSLPKGPEPPLSPPADGPMPPGTNPWESRPLPPPDPEMMKGGTRQLVEDVVHAAFGPGNEHRRKLFRDYTMRHLMRYHTSWRGELEPTQVPVHFPLTGPANSRKSATAFDPPELVWDQRNFVREVDGPRGLTDHDKEQLRRGWPLQFDLDTSRRSITWESGWIVGANPGLPMSSSDFRFGGFLCVWPLVACGDDVVVPASVVLEKPEFVAARTSSGFPTSPGCFWYLEILVFQVPRPRSSPC